MSEIKNNGKVIDIEETKESKLKAKVSKVGESIKANRKKIIVAGAIIVGAAVGSKPRPILVDGPTLDLILENRPY